MREKRVMKLASRGRRFGAFCIDAVFPFIAGFILIVMSVVLIVRDLSSQYGSYGSPFGDYGYGYGYGYGYDYGHDTTMTGAMAVFMLLLILLLIAYTIVQMVFYRKSQTIGKAILGLQVVSSKNGEPIGFWPMLFREWFVKTASGAVYFLGFIWILIDDKNRGWHDKILDTYVVDLKESAMLAASSAPAPAPQAAPEPAPRRPQTSAPVVMTVPSAPAEPVCETVEAAPVSEPAAATPLIVEESAPAVVPEEPAVIELAESAKEPEPDIAMPEAEVKEPEDSTEGE